jgi:hypothetical protein
VLREINMWPGMYSCNGVYLLLGWYGLQRLFLHVGVGADASFGDPLVDVGGEDREWDAA